MVSMLYDIILFQNLSSLSSPVINVVTTQSDVTDVTV